MYLSVWLFTETEDFYVLSLMAATFAFPFKAIASGLRMWPFGYDFCQFIGFFQPFWAEVSLCTQVLTAINRFFFVVN